MTVLEQKPNISRTQQVRDMIAANPKMTPQEVAKKVGVSNALVYMTIKTDKRKAMKEASIKILKEAGTKETPTDGQKVLRKEITMLNNAIEKWRSQHNFDTQRIDYMTKELVRLKDHVAGLEYVVSYLESRLGIEEK